MRKKKSTGNQFCCKRGRRIKCGFSQCVRSCRSVCPVRRNLCTPFGDIYTRCGVVVRAPSKFILLYHRLDELSAHHQPKRRPWSYTRARIRIRPSTRKTDQPWGGELAEEQNAIRLIARQKYLNWKRAYNVSQCTRYVLFSTYSGRTHFVWTLWIGRDGENVREIKPDLESGEVSTRRRWNTLYRSYIMRTNISFVRSKWMTSKSNYFFLLIVPSCISIVFNLFHQYYTSFEAHRHTGWRISYMQMYLSSVIGRLD